MREYCNGKQATQEAPAERNPAGEVVNLARPHICRASCELLFKDQMLRIELIAEKVEPAMIGSQPSENNCGIYPNVVRAIGLIDTETLGGNLKIFIGILDFVVDSWESAIVST